MIRTELNRHLQGLFFRCIFTIANYVIKTPFYGAQTTLYCALEPSLKNESGNYYSDCKKKRPSRKAQNEDDQKRLWDISEETVELKVSLN